MSAHWHEQLRRLGPCPEALAWVADLLTRRPETTFQEAWGLALRERLGWCAWLAAEVGADLYRARQRVSVHVFRCPRCSADEGAKEVRWVAAYSDAPGVIWHNAILDLLDCDEVRDSPALAREVLAAIDPAEVERQLEAEAGRRS